MPAYPALARTDLDIRYPEDRLTALSRTGVPYSPAMIAAAKADLAAQATPGADTAGLTERYGAKVQNRDFDNNPQRLTEMDALVAYLQMLGTLVDFTSYEPRNAANQR